MSHAAALDLLLGVCGLLITGISGWFVLEFREMRKSVDALNVKIAHIIVKIETHENRIDRIEASTY